MTPAGPTSLQKMQTTQGGETLVDAMARAIERLNPTWKDAQAEARAALAAIEAAGWRVVPVEPTEAMANAVYDALLDAYAEHPTWDEPKHVIEGLNVGPLLKAAIAAAPRPEPSE